MILFFKNKPKSKTYKLNSGMTYVEVIIVLSIFVVISVISVFSYQDFQARIDIRNLSNDIALEIVQAQKLSLSGKLSAGKPPLTSPWRPSYGVYFNLTETGVPPNTGANIFYSFINLSNQDVLFDKYFAFCNPPLDAIHECLQRININKARISAIDVCSNDTCSTPVPVPDDLHITFTRPSSEASISVGSNPQPIPAGSYIRIMIESLVNPSINSSLRIYPFGRIQVGS